MKAEEIVSIVKRSIEVIEAENFKVLGITTDQGANFQRAFKLLNTLGDDFKISLNKKEYFIIRDPPHLLKRTRTHLANGDVILPDGKGNASWAHLRKLYQLDQMSSMRIVPKLSDKHIEDLKGANQMKVKFAAQVVSNTVSAALNYHVASGSIKAAAYATSTFLKNFNDFFYIFNSSSHREKTPLRRPICMQSNGTKYLNEILPWLQELATLNRRCQFLKGWCSNINVLQKLNAKMQAEGLPFISTRNLCQDPLELLFSKVRGIMKFPTAQNFIDCYAVASTKS